jgi:hypothetical protein
MIPSKVYQHDHVTAFVHESNMDLITAWICFRYRRAESSFWQVSSRMFTMPRSLWSTLTKCGGWVLKKENAKRLLKKHFYIGQRLWWNSATLTWSDWLVHNMGVKTRKPSCWVWIFVETFVCAQTHQSRDQRGYFRKMNRVMMDYLKDRDPMEFGKPITTV